MANLAQSSRERDAVLGTALFVTMEPLEFDARTRRLISILQSRWNIAVIDVHEGDAHPHQVNDPVCQRFRVYRDTAVPAAIGYVRAWNQIRSLSKDLQPDLVVGCSFHACAPSLMAANVANARLIYDAHELIVPSKTGPRLSARDQFWYMLEKHTIPRAEVVIAANEYRALRMAQQYSLQKTPLVIQNIAYPQQSDAPNAAVQQSWAQRQDGRVRLLYQGAISPERQLASFVDALSVLPEHFSLYFIGDGPDVPRIKRRINDLNLQKRAHLIGKMKNAEMNQATPFFDIGIISYPFDTENNIYCASNKIYEYAYAGVPVLATNQPPLRDVIEQYGIGMNIPANSSSRDIAGAIIDIEFRRKEYIQNIPRFIHENSWEGEVKRAVKIFQASGIL